MMGFFASLGRENDHPQLWPWNVGHPEQLELDSAWPDFLLQDPVVGRLEARPTFRASGPKMSTPRPWLNEEAAQGLRT